MKRSSVVIVVCVALVIVFFAWSYRISDTPESAVPNSNGGVIISASAPGMAINKSPAASVTERPKAPLKRQEVFAGGMLAMADPSLVGMSQTDLAARFDLIATTGAVGVRFDLFWRDIETTKGVYQWAKYERIALEAQKRHVPLLAILDYAPAWASPAGCDGQVIRCAPENMATFAQFAEDAAAHFVPLGVHYYELWNEPNLIGVWHPKPNAADFASLVRQACPRIKLVDPQAFVVTGGLGLGDTPGDVPMAAFAQQFLAASPGDCFDAVGVHLYGPSAWGQLSLVRTAMVGSGQDHKNIWATEVGAPTSGACGATDNESEARQANTLASDVATWRSYPWVGPLFWSIPVDVPARKNYYGLFCADGTPKPSLSVFAELAKVS